MSEEPIDPPPPEKTPEQLEEELKQKL